MVTELNEIKLAKQTGQVRDLPLAISIQYVDEAREYLPVETSVRRTNRPTLQEHTISLPIAASENVVESVLENWLRTRWTARETISFSLARSRLALTVGDHIVFDDMDSDQPWQITRVEESEKLQISAKAVEVGEIKPVPVAFASRLDAGPSGISAPIVHFLDLPFISGSDLINSNRIAVRSNPWPGPMAVYSSPGDDSFAFRQTVATPATMGVLQGAMPATSTFSRWSFEEAVEIRLFGEALFSATDLSVFAGANALAIRSGTGGWEIVQFKNAEPLGNNVWRVSEFLRGQRGTEVEAAAGSAIDAVVILLHIAVVPIENSANENGLSLDWMIGPVGNILGDPEFTSQSYSPGARGLLPFSPSHLKAHSNPGGDLELSWKRRDRLSADDWALEETAMSEATENYQLTIRENGTIKDTRSVSDPSVVISAAELSSIVGSTPTNIEISAAQISALVGPGPSQTIFHSVN